MTDWKELIRSNKPDVSESSVRTYSSTIKGLLKRLDQGDVATDFFDTNAPLVINYISGLKSAAQQKNLLSPVIAVTKAKEALQLYREHMAEAETQNKADKM